MLVLVWKDYKSCSLGEVAIVHNISASIANLELDSIIFKAQGSNPGIFKRKEGEREYRRFLELALRHSDVPLVPSKVVDIIWHTHILDTKRYISDCNRVFGHYVHHSPDVPDMDTEEKNERIRTTISLYEKYFGKCEWFTAQNFRVGCSPDGACETPPSDCSLN